MRPVDYSDVLRGSLALAGILMTDIDAGGAEFVQMRGFHDRRLRLAWEIHRWPEICRYEQRSFRPPWNAATTYAAGAEVLDLLTLTYFQALQASTGQAPTTAGVTNDAYWAVCQNAYAGDTWTSGTAYTVGTIVLDPTDGNYYQRIAIAGTIVGSGGYLATGVYFYPTGLADGKLAYTTYAGGPNIEWVLPASYWALNPPSLPILPVYVSFTDSTTPAGADWSANGFTFTATDETAAPSTQPALWGLLTPFQRYVAYEQTDINGAALTPIAEVLFAYDRDPRVTTKKCGLPYLVTSDGFAFTTLRHTPAYVWLHYRLRRPTLTGDLFDATLVYTSGRQVYYVNSTTGIGNFYTCLATTTADQNPVNTPAKWSVVELPYVFREYLVQAGYADWLTSDGQGDKADKEEGKAGALLELEADKLQRQQGQVNRLNFRS